jgi:DNA topoisomerase-3
MPAVGAAVATRHGGALRFEEIQRIACTGALGQDNGCGFAFMYSPAVRTFDKAEAEQLLLERRVGPLTGFRSKAGFPFTAEIALTFDEETRNHKFEFSFGDDNKNSEETDELGDFGSQHSLGTCPKCGSAVFEHGSNYVCEKSVPTVAQASPSCDFKIGQIILQQQIVRKQMHKLLATGKTDLLDQFVSNRTRKAFRAMLVWDAAAENVTFEFGENVSAQTQEKLTDLKLSQNLGICPKCAGGIYEHISSYVCEKSFCTPLQSNPSCDLRFEKSISQRLISHKEITKLLKT